MSEGEAMECVVCLLACYDGSGVDCLELVKEAAARTRNGTGLAAALGSMNKVLQESTYWSTIEV